MKTSLKKPAFTLLEMIIAITVFTIFIGFAISTYLTFHRADQEALAMRSLMLEAQGTMDLLISSIKENTIDYDEFYAEGSSLSESIFNGFQSNTFPNFTSGESHVLNDATLALRSPDGKLGTVFIWDKETETLNLYTTEEDEEGNLTNELSQLHNDTTRVTYVNFRIFPDENPYALTSADEADIGRYYQPTVQIEMTFAVPGRIQEEVTVDFQTSVTSRFYQ